MEIDTALISTIISTVLLGIYKFFISRPGAKKSEQKILTKVDEKIAEATTPVRSDTLTPEARLESAEVSLEKLRVERQKLASLKANMTYDEAFYAIQKNVSMYDSVTRYCSISKMSYSKLVPKPEGHYTFYYNGHMIAYDIIHMRDVDYDDDGKEIINITPTFRITGLSVA